MTNVLVFKSRLTLEVEAIIGRAAQKRAGEYYTVVCAHGLHSPSFVAIEEHGVSEVVLTRIRKAAQAAYDYAMPDKQQPSAEQLEFARLDEQCRWGTATTQERVRRDELAGKGA
jgi:hypothetical protein